MITQFDNFDEAIVRRESAEHQSLFRQVISIAIVEFVPMAMAFRHFRDTVAFFGERAISQLAAIGAESHGPAFVLHSLLVRHQIYHWMRALRIELRAARIFQSGDIPREFDHRTLHT